MSDHELVSAVEKLTKKMTEISEKMDIFVAYLDKAEKEVPEYLRRHTMYIHDLVHIRVAMEQAGLQIDPKHGIEIERAISRLSQCIDEESSQGGVFHQHTAKLIKEGLLDKDGRKRDFQK